MQCLFYAKNGLDNSTFPEELGPNINVIGAKLSFCLFANDLKLCIEILVNISDP